MMTSNPEEVTVEGLYIRDVTKDVAMEDSFQPPVPDSVPDADAHKDQQKQIDEGYASSISCDYSVEEEFASDSEREFTVEDCPELIDGKFLGEIPLNGDIPDDDDVGASPFTILRAKPKSVADWKMSWAKECKIAESAFVNVYSYFQEETGVGGYAVILRNMSAEPVAALASFSLDGKFYLFQVMDGLVAGLHLASTYGCSNPYLRCNSRAAVSLFGGKDSYDCGCNGKKVGTVCLTCARFYGPSIDKDCYQTLMPLLLELESKKLDALNFDCLSSKMNKAARFLAKYAKDKALLDREALVDMRNRRRVAYKVDTKPSDFPDALVSILMDDAYDSLYYNLDARTRFETSFHKC